jgi:hypothetical protein
LTVGADIVGGMTLVVDAVDEGSPQLHALVIGVGDYRHFAGGNGAPMEPDLGLGQLSSPPTSAIAFAHWLTTGWRHSKAKLGSIDLLLSAGQNVEGFGAWPVDVAEATASAVSDACEAWFERANAHPDNIACFFFCGHGLMRDEVALLCSDFGASKLNPFKGAINFEKLRLGMGRCAAGTQLFFVDTCRQLSVLARELLDYDALVPIASKVTAPPRSDHIVLHSTAPLAKAYGEANTASRFTRALIASLAGLGAMKSSGTWVVTTSGLGRAVKSSLDRLVLAEKGPAQLASPEGSPLGAVIQVVGKNAPRVPLFVEIDPGEAAPVARLSVHRNGVPVPSLWEDHHGKWTTELAAGLYDVVASFEQPSTYQDADSREVYVMPPDAIERLTVV